MQKKFSNLITRLNSTQITEYLIVLVMILLSGCVFFTQAFRFETTLVFMLLTMLFLNKHRSRLSEVNVKYMAAAVLVLVLNLIVNIRGMKIGNFKDYFVLLLGVLCVISIFSLFSLKQYQKMYVDIMSIIAVVSLCCFVIQLTNEQSVELLSDTEIVPGYTISWYHTWGWDYIFRRNAGPFWEPGAFQGYLILAIMFELNDSKKKQKGDFVKLAVLSAAVISTKSTAGYLLLGLLFTYLILRYFRKSKLKLDDRKNVIRLVLLITAAAAAVLFILTSGTVTDKLSGSNESFQLRLKDVTSSFDIILKRPLFGYGIMGGDLISAWESMGLTGNSVGIFAAFQFFGLFFGLALVFMLMRGAVITLGNLNFLVVLAVFMLIFMTESVITFPVYYVFIFLQGNNIKLKFREEEKR